MTDDNKPVISFDDAKKLFEGADNINNEPAPKPKMPPMPIGHQKYQEPANVRPIERAVEKENHQEEGKNLGLTILFWFGVVVLAFLVGFSVVNGPAIGKKISYWFSSIRGKLPDAKEYTQPNVNVSDQAQTATSESLPDNHLIIAKINVDAPVVWGVEDIDVQNKLLEGVVQYKKTSLPNQDGGNVFITGHSSNFWWVKSDYNQVFALLPQLENGDEIILTYQKVKYVYRVYDKFVVSPDQVEVMNSVEGKSTLTLMSCVPIGTNYKRLIVRAELLFKDAGKSQVQTPTSSPGQTQTQTPSGGEQPVQINGQQQNTGSPSNINLP